MQHVRQGSGILRSACLYVCVPVDLSASISLKPVDRFSTNFFAQIRCGRGSVLLWRRCDTLCTSSFMDDVTFGRSGPYGDAWKAEPLTYYHGGSCDTGVESDVYECLVVLVTCDGVKLDGSYSTWIGNQRESAVIDFVWLRSELKNYCWKSREHMPLTAP